MDLLCDSFFTAYNFLDVVGMDFLDVVGMVNIWFGLMWSIGKA